jgi:riboflavin kinase/FMN adenylyltransferase
VAIDGEVISSTAIRLAVARGDLGFAEKSLARPYAVFGKVVPGQKMGQKLGFPTANIDAAGLQLPPDGVYAVRVHIGEKDFQGIANLGIRPTVSQDSKRVLEVHVFAFDGDLYGMDVEVEFLRFVRGERKFASLADLRAQIDKDIAEVRT